MNVTVSQMLAVMHAAVMSVDLDTSGSRTR